MRRKSTRAATKASPEKVKEEKTPKKTRRHSKRHKPTSSESGSEGEVSVSSNDNNAPVGGELWTVTQTEQSNNDIGKIKICLARPTPSTPERTERASKRLRNKPAVQVEDSPSEEKPVRRTRRSRGGSSPTKKEEIQQPLEHESPEEKKGKGKSKGKHKSKIEQTAPVVEQTEMQSEISENVQVTAQSPQNLDNSDADIVDRDLNRVEDEKSGEKSGELPSPDDQDTNDNIVDASNNDLSNNNVANESQDMVPVDEQTIDANNVGIDINKEDCNKSLEKSETFDYDGDVSMKEVSAFYTTNDSKSEDSVAALNDSQIETKVELTEAVKSEQTLIKDETVSSEIKEESEPENNINEQLTKHEDSKELLPSKEEVKQEFMKEEASAEGLNKDERDVKSETNEDRKVKKEESRPLADVGDCEIARKAENVEANENANVIVSDPNREAKAPSKQEPVIEDIKGESSLLETSAPDESLREQPTDMPNETELALNEAPESKEVEKTPEQDSTHGQNIQHGLVEEKLEDTKADLIDIKCQKPGEQSEEISSMPNQSEEDDSQNKDNTLPEIVVDAEQFPTTEDIKSPKLEPKPKRPLISKLWGQTSSKPNILYICTSQLLKMYPTVVLADEKEVKLDCIVRDHLQKKAPVKLAPVERRVSREDIDKLAPKVERQDSNAPTSTNTTSIALNRKISIVEDEASSLRPPPSPAKHDRSSILFITNLVRPFTVKQLRGLLERTGKIVEGGFWTDRIKSKCYVQYETAEEAEATRNAIHGVLWPIGNGKKLIIDFSTAEAFENAKNPPIIQVQIAAPATKGEPEKENHEPQKRLTNIEAEHAENGNNKPSHRNEKESRGRRGRSSSVSNKRQHSPSRRSRSPAEEIKKKRREEPAPQRAMDDLFRKTEATPSIYWQALQPEEIALKQKQRLERMEAHKRKMESQTHQHRNSDRQRGGPYRRRY